MSVITQNGIKWATMETNPNALIYMGLHNAINNAENLDKATLVDRVNKKLAIKAGIEVPSELIINKHKPKEVVVKNTSLKKNNQNQAKVRTERKNASPANPLTFTDQEVITITGKPANGKVILANRKMVVTGTKDGAYIGFLINEKDGSLQRSEITMQVEFTNKAILTQTATQ